MLPIRSREGVARLASRFCDHTGKVGGTNPQRAPVMSSEDLGRKKPCSDRGVGSAERMKKFADQAHFLQLFGGGTDSVRDLYKAAHNVQLRLAHGR